MERHDQSTSSAQGLLGNITQELTHHMPFTLFGALTGVVIAVVFVQGQVPRNISHYLFAVFHPAHVFFSAVVTTAMYRKYAKRNLLATIVVGYVGAVGIGTLSDSLIPYLSELFLGIHDPHVHAHAHLGFIEEWYLVNPMALLGIALAYLRPTTKLPHAGHVLLSTWASLFHILMALTHEGPLSIVTGLLIPIVLFVAVWLPCCTSDILFPVLLSKARRRAEVP